MKKVLTVLAILAIAATAQAEILAAWNPNGMAATYLSQGAQNPTSLADDMGAASLYAGTGFANQSASGAGSHYLVSGVNGTSFANSVSLDEIIKIDVAAVAGYELSLSALDVRMSASASGPHNVQFAYLDGSSWIALGTAVTWTGTGSGNGAQLMSVDVSGIAALQNVTSATLGIVAWGGNGGATDWLRIDGRATGATAASNGLIVNGTLAQTQAIPEPATMALLGLGAVAMALRKKLSK